jgi:TFIIF-interacting CTD phosphatase-like protein
MTNNGVVKVRSCFTRDLSKIGRDLSKVIIIDNLPENFRMQNNNGLPIITWTDNMRDTQLRDLSLILEDIYKHKVTDVRVIIKRLKDEILKSKNVNSPYLKIEISKLM